MTKEQAEKEKSKYANLNHKILTHKEYRKRMQVIEVGVGETSPNSKDYYVYCRLKGDLGEVHETIDYVTKNYTSSLTDVK